MNRGVFYIILANVVAATSYLSMKEAMNGMPPSYVLILRVIVCALVLLPVMSKEIKARKVSFDKTDWILLIIMSLVGCSAALVTGIYGLKASTASNAALLIGVEPIGIVILSALFLREHINVYRAVGIVFALAGAMMIVNNGIPLFTNAYSLYLEGDVLLVLSGICFATYSVAGKRVISRHSTILITFITGAFSLVGYIPFAITEGSSLTLSSNFWQSLPWVIYLGIFVTLLSYFWWNKSLQYLEASQIAVFINLQPLVGVLLGWIILGENISAFAIFGGLLIGIGVCISMKTAKKQVQSQN